ncbi:MULTISPECIES: sigma factor-like helix-turn-helix DNA-binding protein [Novosphingobium]|nr:sigma factor-like helix-turn-helix DNA-binding protein [Novosphingobium resinovorum]GLK43955.1 hypothetical protein GCM10017612_18750 [Novosphingobium resinovorum]
MAMQSRNHNQAQIAAGSERRDRISRLRSEGWTFKRIAAELHISQSRAAQIHKRAVELDEQASRTIPAHRITRQTPIEILPLSIRTSSALLNGGYRIFGDLLPFDRARQRQVLGLLNFGRACLDELADLMTATEPVHE